MSDEPILVKEFNEELDVEERVREGGVLSTLYLEVQGNDEQAAREALEKMVFERMGSEPYVDLLEVRLYEITKDAEKGFYSGVVEVKLVSRDFRWFVNTIMRYGPSAIEIIEPEEYNLSSDEMHSLVADVSELTQTFTSQILALLKDEERLAFYNKMLESKD